MERRNSSCAFTTSLNKGAFPLLKFCQNGSECLLFTQFLRSFHEEYEIL